MQSDLMDTENLQQQDNQTGSGDLQMDTENLQPQNNQTGSGDLSTVANGNDDSQMQGEAKSNKLAEPLNFEQKVSSEIDKGGGQTIMLEGSAASEEVGRADDEQLNSSTADSKEMQSDISRSENAAGKTDLESEDVPDECLKSAEEPADEWLDILGSGQLKKRVLTAGTESSRPMQGSMVTVKVTGSLDSGVCFQESTETFILGDGDVIAAIDMAVALMNQGETAEVYTVPRFAYGTAGRDPNVPKDATLTLTLELVNVQPPVDFTKLSAEERLQFGEKKRERGNELFGREDYSGAINSYSKAVKFLDSTSGGLTGETSLLQKILDSRLKCYNNMAASQLKIGATDAAIRSCEEVLLTQPENLKALYRLGKAHSSKGQTDKAIPLLKKALKLDPESKLLHRELASLTQKQKKEADSEKTMYKKMFGSMAGAAETPKDSKSSSSVLKWSLVAGGVIAAAASVGFAYYRASH